MNAVRAPRDHIPPAPKRRQKLFSAARALEVADFIRRQHKPQRESAKHRQPCSPLMRLPIHRDQYIRHGYKIAADDRESDPPPQPKLAPLLRIVRHLSPVRILGKPAMNALPREWIPVPQRGEESFPTSRAPKQRQQTPWHGQKRHIEERDHQERTIGPVKAAHGQAHDRQERDKRHHCDDS
jgi:hypothetical protein